MDVKGDLINATFEPYEKYSPYGVKMISRPFLEDGVLKTIHGNTRLMRYMGLEPIGTYNCIKVREGSMPFENMLAGKVLHVVKFSDFHVDEVTGDFGSEIRLGYLYDGEGNVTCVTGGSVTGNVKEVMKDMRLSIEKYSFALYEGPKAIFMKNVTVAGE